MHEPRQRHQRLWLQTLGFQQRIGLLFGIELKQQIGQTGADRQFCAEQLHAVTRFGFDIQVVARQMLPHLSHIILQGSPADKPFIGQIFQLQ